MNDHFKSIILNATNASELFEIGVIQKLWSGYGKIVRLGLKDSNHKSVVVKHVCLPQQSQHPRGWNTDISHQRKLKSYQIETTWYKQWSHRCAAACKVPHCLALETKDDEILIVLEDLEASGYTKRKDTVNETELKTCLTWLAHFHATFLNEIPQGLWETGTYWHLETRPDELKALEDLPLKKVAQAIDQKLKSSPFQTFVHGDAKLANFCFSETSDNVAAVDFQYVGGGCGMKDVAYFIGSCLDENACEAQETALLNDYFTQLKTALLNNGRTVDFEILESNWRSLYPFAWADFHRFLKGWSPGHWKINSYSEQLTKKVREQINAENRSKHP